MSDFIQNGAITTLHDLGSMAPDRLEEICRRVTQDYPVALILPVTAQDMRSAAFARIVDELRSADYVGCIAAVLNVAPEVRDYREARARVQPLGDRCRLLWADSPRFQQVYRDLGAAGFDVATPGKGRAVWTAVGYLLSEPNLHAFVVHDCDIVEYRRHIVSRLILPVTHPSLDFEFCKAYYARYTTRMHGRVVRLLVAPLLRAFIATQGYDPFLVFMNSFRYPLAGELGVSSTLARSIRIPGDWGLEVGTLAEVYRNTSVKRVAQVDICHQYDHKHSALSLDDPSAGLMRMSHDILMTFFRTLSSMGKVFHGGDYLTLRAAYIRNAQDAIRQYRADALINGLDYDQHEEEGAVEGFAGRIVAAGHDFREDPSGADELPAWSRVLSAFPDVPARLRAAVREDREEFDGRAAA